MHNHKNELLAAAVASDVMTRSVTTIPVDASVRDVAITFSERNIGGAPVVDSSDAPVGMVSDGDLFGRRPTNDRAVWWLAGLASDTKPSSSQREASARPIHQLMSQPLIYAGPSTNLSAVAHVMRQRRIKRVPILDGGKIVGLVTRAHLVQSIDELSPKAADAPSNGLYGILRSLVGGAAAPRIQPQDEKLERPKDTPSAEGFEALLAQFQRERDDDAHKLEQLKKKERAAYVEKIEAQPVTDEIWHTLLSHAEMAAKHGEKEFLMLQFPAEVCRDGGRAFANAEEHWEDTLQGEAAEVFARWREALKPKGFSLEGRILSFRDGMPEDFGLILIWAH